MFLYGQKFEGGGTVLCQRRYPGYGPFGMPRKLQFQKMTDGFRTIGDLYFGDFNQTLQINIQQCGISNFA
jgi:hypothetical protein